MPLRGAFCVPGSSNVRYQMQTAKAVAERLLALIAVSSAAYEQPPTSIRAWLENNALENALSPSEKEFVYSDHPSQAQLVQASWRLEACPVLLWALGLIQNLSSSSVHTDWAALGPPAEITQAPRSFVESAALRAADELLHMQDKIHSLHWGVRAGPSGRKLFPNAAHEEDADASVVQERHYAINWLCEAAESWDDVQTDT